MEKEMKKKNKKKKNSQVVISQSIRLKNGRELRGGSCQISNLSPPDDLKYNA
jgi:hypothetical protein